MRAIDLFAGAGGFSTGAVAAGCTVVWAANHWPAAVAVHSLNHPSTAHTCQDLHQANWSQVPQHDLLLASPACTGHTRARGKDRPHHDAARSTAWAVVSAAETCRPAFGIVENVPEFKKWSLFPQWASCLKTLGYSIAEHVIDAADLGVPQHRRRLFLVLARSRAPLQLRLPRQAHTPVRSILDFDAGVWNSLHQRRRPLAAKTAARIRAGRAQHGDRFLISYYGTSRGGHSLDAPIGTITTRDRYALVDGDRLRMLSVDEARAAMSFPSSYQLPVNRATAMMLLGNAVAPTVSEVLCRAVMEAA